MKYGVFGTASLEDIHESLTGTVPGITGNGAENTISDVCTKLDELTCYGVYNLSDIVTAIRDTMI